MERSPEKQMWKVSMEQISTSMSSIKLESVLSIFQDLERFTVSKFSSVKEIETESPLSGLLNISDMFPTTTDCVAEAGKLVANSGDLSAENSIYTCIPGTPGELEGCLLSRKDKQLIHKLVTQAMYKSIYKKGNPEEPTDGIAKCVSYLQIPAIN